MSKLNVSSCVALGCYFAAIPLPFLLIESYHTFAIADVSLGAHVLPGFRECANGDWRQRFVKNIFSNFLTLSLLKPGPSGLTAAKPSFLRRAVTRDPVQLPNVKNGRG